MIRWPLILFILLTACAGEDPRDEHRIRRYVPPPEPFPEAGVDAAVGDASSQDVGLDQPDATRPIPANRPIWVVVRDQDWRDGVRGQLEPPHQPVSTVIETVSTLLGDVGLLVDWAGPGSTLLDTLITHGASTAPVYDLQARLNDGAQVPADIEADISLLVADPLTESRALTLDGRLVLGIRGITAHPIAWAAARRRLAELPIDAGWMIELATEDPLPLGDDILGVMPTQSYGFGSHSASNWRATVRERVHEVGYHWLPLASPPGNDRLDAPDAAAEQTDGGRAFKRALILARRAADGPIVVDGIGRWRDDRQLDAVDGPPTVLPASLTTGLRYAGYRSRRLDTLAQLHQPAEPIPNVLAAPALLLPLIEPPGVLIERLEQSADGIILAVDGNALGEPLEVLLDDRPFIIPEAAQLRYQREGRRVYLDLVFANGTRLHKVEPLPHETGLISVPLDSFTGQRVEELVLIHPNVHGSESERIAQIKIH